MREKHCWLTENKRLKAQANRLYASAAFLLFVSLFCGFHMSALLFRFWGSRARISGASFLFFLTFSFRSSRLPPRAVISQRQAVAIF
jgi:hypothetical protein